jgi:LysR family hydrogen peroxide-inducible transcriptional activator
MILPTLRQLQYFLALAETKSFKVASENCHITQPTLSAGIAELENILGKKLFDRGTRHVQLTTIGEELLPLARSTIEQGENLVRSAMRHRAPLTGQLSLGIIPTIAPYVLPKLLPRLQIDFPHLELHLKEDVTGRQLDALKNGTIDLILMAFPFDTLHMEQMILWTEPFFLARQNKGQSQSEQMKLDDLKSETILLLDDGHCLRDHVLSACQLSVNAENRKTLGATSLQTLIQMVQNGYGATLLPRMAIDPYQMPNNIIINRFSNPQPTRQIGLCWRKSDPRSEEFRILGGFIKEISYIKA